MNWNSGYTAPMSSILQYSLPENYINQRIDEILTSERRVPLHPHVIATGFLDFVNAKHTGPLFYDPNRTRRGTKTPQAKLVGKKVADWVHSLGLEVGRKHRKDPNHGWRHTFRTQAREAGIIDTILDAIEGHTQSSEGRRNGSTSLTAMLRAIEKIELPE